MPGGSIIVKKVVFYLKKFLFFPSISFSFYIFILPALPEYDISHPIQVDSSGRFLSRDLANGNVRRKRDVGSSFVEPVYFKVSGFGQDFHLNVTLNHQLFSTNFEIEIRGNGSSELHYEIDHCHYIGQLLNSKGEKNKVAISNCDGLVRKFGYTMDGEGGGGTEVQIFVCVLCYYSLQTQKEIENRAVNELDELDI